MQRPIPTAILTGTPITVRKYVLSRKPSWSGTLLAMNFEAVDVVLNQRAKEKASKKQQ